MKQAVRSLPDVQALGFCRPSRGSLSKGPKVEPVSHEDIYFAAIRELEQGSLEAARQFVSKLSSLEPDEERTIILQALLLEEDGKLAQALALLEDFTRKNLRSAHARSNLARLQWRNGDHGKALATLRFSLTQEPNQERALHLFASAVESQSSFRGAYNQLMTMSLSPKAWAPAWVAAEISARVGQEKEMVEALLRSAQRKSQSFPPNVARLKYLLSTLSSDAAQDCWRSLRPYCGFALQEELDALYLSAPLLNVAPPSSPQAWGYFRGGLVGQALTLESSRPTLVLSTIRLVNPEEWVDPATAGRLSRGLGLLLGEVLLFHHQVVSELALPCVADQGMVYEAKIATVEELVSRRSDPSAERFLSLYLTYQKSGMFVLDAEIYDHTLQYRGRASSKADDPGSCLLLLAEKVVESLDRDTAVTRWPAWACLVTPEHAFSRDTAAAFQLAAQGLLRPQCLPNPGLGLDLLAEHAADTQSPLDLITLWWSLRSAAVLKLPTAEQQLQTLESIMKKSPVLSRLL